MTVIDPKTARVVREAIYDAIVNRGVAPTPADVATAHRLSPVMTKGAFRSLADEHIIILRPNTLEIWAAPPFAAMPSRFLVRARQKTWFGTCGWDAFGILAALGAEGTVEAQCGASGEPMSCGVRNGRTFGDAVLHLLVPAARFWDDIIYT